MAFNIKNEETIAIAREIAARTGESIAQVIDVAIREHAERRDVAFEAKVDRIKRLCHDVTSRVGPDVSSADIDALLYDPDTGLPW